MLRSGRESSMPFCHLEPDRLLIGYSDEPVMTYVLERIPSREQFAFLPLEALEADPNAYIRCDGNVLHIHCETIGSIVVRSGIPIYARVFVRGDAVDPSGIRRFLDEYLCWSLA